MKGHVTTLLFRAGCCMCTAVAAVGADRLHGMGIPPTSLGCGELMCYIFVVTSRF